MSATGQFVALDPKRFLDDGFELRAPFNQANASGVPTLTFGANPVNSIGFDLPARQASYFDRATYAQIGSLQRQRNDMLGPTKFTANLDSEFQLIIEDKPSYACVCSLTIHDWILPALHKRL